jgi:hypothetical protein
MIMREENVKNFKSPKAISSGLNAPAAQPGTAALSVS